MKDITDAGEAARERWYVEDPTLEHEVQQENMRRVHSGQPEDPGNDVKMKETGKEEEGKEKQKCKSRVLITSGMTNADRYKI